MVTRARANVPAEFIDNVRIRHENVMTAFFEPGSFDLILSVGLLAHVDSPEEFIAKVTSLIRPGGSLIIEFTDSRHVVGRIGRLFGRLKEFVAPSKYPTNRLSFEIIAPIFRKYNLKIVSIFRYARLPIPSIERILPDAVHQQLVNFIFGVAGDNTAAWLGNEYICLLTRETSDCGDKSLGDRTR
jgi:SAM-dependent methyltransferase